MQEVLGDFKIVQPASCPRVILGWCRKQFKCKSKALMAKASISPSTATNSNEESLCNFPRVSVQGVKSIGGHFACLCQGFDFYEVKTGNES